MRFRSVCIEALKPASSRVSAPIDATAVCDRRRKREEDMRPSDEVDAGRHHGRGMDQRTTGVGPAMASGSQV